MCFKIKIGSRKSSRHCGKRRNVLIKRFLLDFLIKGSFYHIHKNKQRRQTFLFVCFFFFFWGGGGRFEKFRGPSLKKQGHGKPWRPLPAFPFNHCQNNDKPWERIESWCNGWHEFSIRSITKLLIWTSIPLGPLGFESDRLPTLLQASVINVYEQYIGNSCI